MSRSVKIFYPWHSAPATTCWLIWRMAIVLLIMQLVDSLVPGIDKPRFRPHGHPLMHRPSWSRGRPNGNRITDDYGKSSSMKFKNRDFEVSYDVFDANNEERKDIKPPSPKPDKDVIDDTIKRVFNDQEVRGSRDFAFRRFHPRNLESSAECMGQLICDAPYEAGNSMENIINEAVGNKKEFADVLSHINEMSTPNEIPNDENVQGLCKASKSKIFVPTRVKKEISDDHWIQVVNTQQYRQVVVISKCEEIEKKCTNEFSDPTFRTVCTQHYNYQSLVVINSTDIQPYVSDFRIPSGCCCWESTAH